MISSGIDGSVNGSNQLFDLLSLVSDPQAYAEKVRKLEEATAENKKFVELVAPASDIMALRDKSQQDREQAANELAIARDKAAEIIKAAQEKAASTVDEAQKFASDMQKLAADALKDVERQKAELSEAIKAARSAEAASKHATASFKKMTDEARDERDAASAAMREATMLKADIIARHNAFLESF